MLYIKWFFILTIGFSSGFVTAAAFVAFIAMLGIFPKIAAKTNTARACLLYENCLIYGILLFTLVQFFFVYHAAGYSALPISPIGLGIFILSVIGLFGGIYVGFLIGGLSEVLNVLPIYARKTHIQKQILLAIYFLAIGKALFTCLQFFVIKL